MPRKILLVAVLLFAATYQPQTSIKSAVPEVQHQEVVIDWTMASGEAFRRTANGVSLAEAETGATIITAEIPVPLTNVEPFLAVAPSITFGNDSEELFVSYRFAYNEWSEWADIVPDRDVTPKGSGKLSALLFLPAATAKVQFKLSLQRSNLDLSPIISAMKLSFISPGKSTTSSSTQLRSSKNVIRQLTESSTAKYPKPTIASRVDWGCPDGEGNPRGAPSYTSVTHLIVHHTAGANTSSDWAAVVRSIWNFHIFTNGWSDIGYNYLIDPNGVIYEGRGGGDNVVGAHFSCQNSGTMGVSMLGTFTSVLPTTAATNSLKEILSWKADQRDLDPTGSSYHAGMQQTLANISGHRDGNGLPRSCTTTECPGDLFYPTLSNLRSEIKGLVTPANDYSITSNITSQVIAKGNSATFTVNSATTKGSSQTINFSLRNLPVGITSNFTSTAITTGSSSQLTLTIPESFPSGVYPISILATGTTKRALDVALTVTGTIASVSAASYQKAAPVAPDSIVSAFGANLTTETKSAEMQPLPTTLANVTVKIKDAAGVESSAPLFFVSPLQINYLLPSTVATGTATVTITNKMDVVAVGALNIAPLAPGLFSANANGQGVAVGSLQRRQSNGTDVFEALAQFDEAQKLFLPRLLDLRTQTEEFFLTLYGTGFRSRNSTQPITAQIGGTDVEVLYAGAQEEYAGLAQLNLRLPASLAGRGQVNIVLKIAEQTANPLTISFK